MPFAWSVASWSKSHRSLLAPKVDTGERVKWPIFELHLVRECHSSTISDSIQILSLADPQLAPPLTRSWCGDSRANYAYGRAAIVLTLRVSFLRKSLHRIEVIFGVSFQYLGVNRDVHCMDGRLLTCGAGCVGGSECI